MTATNYSYSHYFLGTNITNSTVFHIRGKILLCVKISHLFTQRKRVNNGKISYSVGSILLRKMWGDIFNFFNLIFWIRI